MHLLRRVGARQSFGRPVCATIHSCTVIRAEVKSLEERRREEKKEEETREMTKSAIQWKVNNYLDCSVTSREGGQVLVVLLAKRQANKGRRHMKDEERVDRWKWHSLDPHKEEPATRTSVGKEKNPSTACIALDNWKVGQAKNGPAHLSVSLFGEQWVTCKTETSILRSGNKEDVYRVAGAQSHRRKCSMCVRAIWYHSREECTGTIEPWTRTVYVYQSEHS